jgi:hypothetical protein
LVPYNGSFSIFFYYFLGGLHLLFSLGLDTDFGDLSQNLSEFQSYRERFLPYIASLLDFLHSSLFQMVVSYCDTDEPVVRQNDYMDVVEMSDYLSLRPQQINVSPQIGEYVIRILLGSHRFLYDLPIYSPRYSQSYVTDVMALVHQVLTGQRNQTTLEFYRQYGQDTSLQLFEETHQHLICSDVRSLVTNWYSTQAGYIVESLEYYQHDYYMEQMNDFHHLDLSDLQETRIYPKTAVLRLNTDEGYQYGRERHRDHSHSLVQMRDRLISTCRHRRHRR